MALKEKQKERYLRQLKLPAVGLRGQEKIFKAKVLVIGVGGLGSPVALYLAAAGVGKIGIVDSEKVELSNLQRQIIHVTSDVGKSKIISAKKKINSLNPDIEIVPYYFRLDKENALEIIKGYDIICDCTDNFPSRYLINDVCIFANKPLVHTSVSGFDGQIMTIIPGKSACYRCLYPQQPPAKAEISCRETGILGTAAGILGTLASHEVLKLILGVGEGLTGSLLVFNGMDSSFREVKVSRQKNCTACSKTDKLNTLIGYEEHCQD